MKLFIPTDLEAHLIAAHGIPAEDIARSREKPNHTKSTAAAHDLLHSMGEQTHTHE